MRPEIGCCGRDRRPSSFELRVRIHLPEIERRPARLGDAEPGLPRGGVEQVRHVPGAGRAARKRQRPGAGAGVARSLAGFDREVGRASSHVEPPGVEDHATGCLERPGRLRRVQLVELEIVARHVQAHVHRRDLLSGG